MWHSCEERGSASWSRELSCVVLVTAALLALSGDAEALYYSTGSVSG